MNSQTLLETRLNNGKHQFIGMMAIISCIILDGVEMGLIPIILQDIKHQWHLSLSTQIMMTQMTFVGFMVGVAIGGYVGDRVGKRKSILIGVTLQLILGYSSALSQDQYQFMTLRCLTTIGIGMVMSNIVPMLNDFYPTHLLQISIILGVGLGFTIGFMIDSVVNSLLQPDSPNRWRFLIVITNSLSLLSLICTLFMKESFVFYLNKQLFPQAFASIEVALHRNNQPALTQNEKQQLMDYYQSDQAFSNNNNYSEIFKQSFLKQNLLCAFIWFYSMFSVYALILYLPINFAHKEHGYSIEQQKQLYVVSSFIDISMQILLIMVKYNEWCPRTRVEMSVVFSVVIVSLCLSLMQQMELVGLVVAKGASQLLGAQCYQLTNCLFPHYISSRVQGFHSFCGRVGSIIMPLLLFNLNKLGSAYYLVFQIVFGVFAFMLFLMIEFKEERKDEQQEQGKYKEMEEQ